MMGLLAVFLVGLLYGSAHSATITLTAVASPVNEGADISVQCSIGGTEVRDVAVALEIDATSTAENGYDAEVVEAYQCVVAAGATTGTVNIPTFADTVLETTTDTLVITGTAVTPALDTVTGTASFVITDDGLGAAPTIRVRNLLYQAMENDLSMPIIVELVDVNGDVVPVEDNGAVGFLFLDDTATGGTTGAGAGDDYDNTATANILGSTMGIPTIQSMISIPLFDDTLPENVETFSFFLDTATSDLAVDDSVEHLLFIGDDDKPGLYVLNSYSVLPRRSRRAVTQYAFTENANDGIVWTSGPFVLSDSTVNNIGVAGADGIELILPRPTSNTRNRFNWYTFSTTETTPAGNFDLFATSSISATGVFGRRLRAPIDVLTASTVTVCPASLNVGETDLGTPLTIAVRGGVRTRTLRWSVYRNPGTRSDRRLSANNGRVDLTLSKLSDVGLYTIFQRNRGRRGWVQYVNVIPSECPCGTYHDVGTCDGGPLQCQHGGFVDPFFDQGLCTCPPGYVGRLCEIPIDLGLFGNNGQYHISDFFPGNRFGRGVTFSFSYPFGSSCAPGFYGPGCFQVCSAGFFGPGCDFTCNCVDDQCLPNGECLNGCAPGFSGYTCQEV